ncbi:MAG: HlyD family efflux transporter periplasmic adaptor subunit [Chloroflexota bacterium]
MSKWVILFVCLGAAAVGGFYYLQSQNAKPSTVALQEVRQSKDGPIQMDDTPQTAGLSKPDGMSRESGRVVTAEGTLVPMNSSTLSMIASGTIEDIFVTEGDYLEAGTAILRLHNTQEEAAVRQAEAQLLRAQAHMQELRMGARAQEILQAEAALDAANARLARLTEAARSVELGAAEAKLAAAQAAYQELFTGPDNEAQIAARAALANAEAARTTSQRAYDGVKWRNDVGMLPQSQQLMEATNNYEAAQARYDQLFTQPNAGDVSAANANIKQAEADLNKVRSPATDAEIAEAEAEVRRAAATLALIKAGSRDEVIAAAAADIVAAEALLDSALSTLANRELRTPYAGTIALLDISIGEYIHAGEPVALLVDTTAWQIETDDLTEENVIYIQPDDEASITLDAIPDLVLTGAVQRIKSIGQNRQGDITYTVVIHLTTQDPRLRWGMTASVVIHE